MFSLSALVCSGLLWSSYSDLVVQSKSVFLPWSCSLVCLSVCLLASASDSPSPGLCSEVLACAVVRAVQCRWLVQCSPGLVISFWL